MIGYKITSIEITYLPGLEDYQSFRLFKMKRR